MIWGSGSNNFNSIIAKEASCSLCNEAVNTVKVSYDYSHIMWIFKGCKNEQYDIQCDNCNSEQRITKKEARALIGSDPVPFMHRYGAYVLLLIIAGWVAFALSFPCSVNPNSQTCKASVEHQSN